MTQDQGPLAAPGGEEREAFEKWADKIALSMPPNKKALAWLAWQARAALPAQGWMPIESAPKDGAHILACDAKSSFGWMDGKPLPPVQTTVHYWPHDNPGFYTSVNEMEPLKPFSATHWKPLDGPLTAAQKAKPTLLTYEEIEAIVAEVRAKHQSIADVAHYAADRAQRAVLERNAPPSLPQQEKKQ